MDKPSKIQGRIVVRGSGLTAQPVSVFFEIDRFYLNDLADPRRKAAINQILFDAFIEAHRASIKLGLSGAMTVGGGLAINKASGGGLDGAVGAANQVVGRELNQGGAEAAAEATDDAAEATETTNQQAKGIVEQPQPQPQPGPQPGPQRETAVAVPMASIVLPMPMEKRSSILPDESTGLGGPGARFGIQRGWARGSDSARHS